MWYLTGEGQQGFLKFIDVKVINRLHGNGRQRKSSRQYKLEMRVPQSINIRKLEPCTW